MSGLGPGRRSSRREHCPVCDKPDGCWIFDDGYVLCLRVESERQTQSGWHIHWTGLGEQPGGDWRDRVRVFNAAPPPMPDGQLCDRAYRALLARCPLSEAHRDDLRRRGMRDAEIERNGYGSLPADGRDDLAAAVIAEVSVDVLGQVPGFHLRDGVPTLRGLPGLLIPVQDVDGAIQRLRVSPDDPAKRAEGKYRWISSSDLDRGIGSGAVAHIAFPKTRQERYARVGVTEGEIKAAIAARRTGMPFISMPGVGAIGALAKILPAVRALGATEALMAFDHDAATNAHVASGLRRAETLLEDDGFTVLQMTWPEEFKGIDDALVAGVLPMIERPVRSADPDDMTTAELRRRYKELSEIHSSVMQTLKNSALNPTQRIVGISVMKNINFERSRSDGAEEFHIPAARIAEDAGVSESTVASAIKTLETGLVLPSAGEAEDAQPIRLFERKVKFAKNVPNKLTGEIRDVKQSFYAPRVESIRDGLAMLARAETVKPRAHGGKRVIVCPDHPDANIVVRRQFHCGECDRLLDRDERTMSPRAAVIEADLAGLNEQDAHLVEDASVETFSRTVKSSIFHNPAPEPDPRFWEVENPIIASWMPPPRPKDERSPKERAERWLD